MQDANFSAYYQARERRERALADAARDPVIAEIHRKMATRYSELIRQTMRAVRLSR